MYRDLETIWEGCNANLMQFIKIKIRDDYDAEDILQEVFLKVCKNIYRLKDASKIKPYIYQTAKNSIIDYYRKRRDIAIEPEALTEQIIVEEENENLNTVISQCLKRMITTLPEKYQKPVKLYDIMGNKHKDISEKLKISISGSKTRVQRGRQRLKELLLDCCDFEFDAMGNIIDYKQKLNCIGNQLQL